MQQDITQQFHAHACVPTQKGAAMIFSVLFFLIVSVTVVVGIAGPLVWEVRSAQAFTDSRNAYFLAEAGIEDVYYRLKSGTTVDTFENVPIDNETASVTITDVGTNEKDLTATGVLANSITRNVFLKLKTAVSGSSFVYGAQVGEGGLIMYNGAMVEGANSTVGNVYTNGPIQGSNGAVITGDAIVASNLVADTHAKSTICAIDQTIAKASPYVDYAQSFSPTNSGDLTKVSLYIKKHNNVSSALVYIVPDNGGVPSTTALASGTLDANLVGSGYGWIDVAFSSPATLTAGQTYWIVLNGTANNSRYWIWCSDSNNGAGNGLGVYTNNWTSPTWTQIVGDLDFKTYFGGSANGIDNVDIGGTARADFITNSTVGGDAYYQTNISGTTVAGNTYPGSTDPAPLNMPISGPVINDWKTTALAEGYTAGDVSISGSGVNQSMQGEIDGNLLVDNGAVLTLTGVIYVTGTITISNNAEVHCDVAFAGDSCVLLSDGWISSYNNAIFAGSGTTGSYILVITALSGCNGGIQQSQCTTNNSALLLSNNATGAIFYAPYSQIDVENGAGITSAVGYQLLLSNNSVITYESGAAATSFSSGPGGSWAIQQWKEAQ